MSRVAAKSPRIVIMHLPLQNSHSPRTILCRRKFLSRYPPPLRKGGSGGILLFTHWHEQRPLQPQRPIEILLRKLWQSPPRLFLDDPFQQHETKIAVKASLPRL